MPEAAVVEAAVVEDGACHGAEADRHKLSRPKPGFGLWLLPGLLDRLASGGLCCHDWEYMTNGLFAHL